MRWPWTIPLPRPTAGQIVMSALILGLGLMGARALSAVDQDLRIMYTEYTLAAADLAHISADVIRFRTTIIHALEAPTKGEFERITAPLPDQHARIQHAVDRYAAASLRVSRSGRSEPEDLRAVRESLDAYFSAASRTVTLLVQAWNAGSKDEEATLRHQAEIHAADNAGPKLIQVSLALDRLLETVAEVAKDMRDEGTKAIRETSRALMVGSFLIGLLNLFIRRSRPSTDSDQSLPGQESASDPPSDIPLSAEPPGPAPPRD